MEKDSKPQINKLLRRIKSTNIQPNFKINNIKRQNEIRLQSLSLKKKRLNGLEQNRQFSRKAFSEKEGIFDEKEDQKEKLKLSPSLSEGFNKEKGQYLPEFNLPRKGSKAQNRTVYSLTSGGFVRKPMTSLPKGRNSKKLKLTKQAASSEEEVKRKMSQTLNVCRLEAVKKFEFHQVTRPQKQSQEIKHTQGEYHSKNSNKSNSNKKKQKNNEQQHEQQQQKDIAFLNAKTVNEIFQYLKQRTQQESQPIREFTEIIFKLVCYYFVSFINENCVEMEFDHLGMVEFVERELGQSYCTVEGGKGKEKRGQERKTGTKKWQEMTEQKKWGKGWGSQQVVEQSQQQNDGPNSYNYRILDNITETQTHVEKINPSQIMPSNTQKSYPPTVNEQQQSHPVFQRKGYRVSSFFKSIEQNQGESVVMNGGKYQALDGNNVRIGVLNRRSRRVANDDGEEEKLVESAESDGKIKHSGSHQGETKPAIRRGSVFNININRPVSVAPSISSTALIITSSNHLISKPPPLAPKQKQTHNLNPHQQQLQPYKTIPQLTKTQKRLIQQIKQLQQVHGQLQKSISQRQKELGDLEDNMLYLNKEMQELEKRAKQASEFSISEECSMMVQNVVKKKQSITKKLQQLIQSQLWNGANYSQSSEIQKIISTKQSSLQKMNLITRKFRACRQILQVQPIIGQMRGAFFMTVDKYTQIVQELQQKLGQAQQSRGLILKSLEDWEIQRKVREKIFNGVVVDYYSIERKVKGSVKKIPQQISTLQQLIYAFAQHYQSGVDSTTTQTNINNTISPNSINIIGPDNQLTAHFISNTEQQGFCITSSNPFSTNQLTSNNIRQSSRPSSTHKLMPVEKEIYAYLQKMMVENQILSQDLQHQKRFAMILEKIV